MVCSFTLHMIIERLRNQTCTCTSMCSSIFAIFIPSKIAANGKESRQKFSDKLSYYIDKTIPSEKKNNNFDFLSILATCTWT